MQYIGSSPSNHAVRPAASSLHPQRTPPPSPADPIFLSSARKTEPPPQPSARSLLSVNLYTPLCPRPGDDGLLVYAIGARRCARMAARHRAAATKPRRIDGLLARYEAPHRDAGRVTRVARRRT